jgi:hypothetical protein
MFVCVFLSDFSFYCECTWFVSFVSWDTLLPLPRYQLLYLFFLYSISSLERDSINKHVSLQYQSGGMIVISSLLIDTVVESYDLFLYGIEYRTKILLPIYSILCLQFYPPHILIIHVIYKNKRKIRNNRKKIWLV